MASKTDKVKFVVNKRQNIYTYLQLVLEAMNPHSSAEVAEPKVEVCGVPCFKDCTWILKI